MPTSQNTVNDRVSRPLSQEQVDDRMFPSNPNDTAKQNYTAIRYGNDHGAISFGHIHKPGDVTAGVKLQTSDGEHVFMMDKDGQRKGWTTSLSPGNFQVQCGEKKEEAEDSMILNALNGNILICASNGKIRLQATDIELIAVGEGSSKGNIRLDATENISTNSKSFKINSVNSLSFNSPSNMEIAANGVLTLYGSVIRGVTDACAVKDSKNRNNFKQKKFNSQ
tara:strand:+ start:643 stop:1311 length:669 start_codon:yes stop_codon:yes gene_type:complete